MFAVTGNVENGVLGRGLSAIGVNDRPVGIVSCVGMRSSVADNCGLTDW